MIDPNIHIDYTRKTISFLLESDFDDVFRSNGTKSLFFELQRPEVSVSNKLSLMAEIFKDAKERNVGKPRKDNISK